MRHRSKHTLFGRQNTINNNNNYSPTQKDNTRTSSTFTLGKNSQLTKNNNKLHSKSTYFYRWGSSSKLSSSLSYVVPSVCSLALLVGGIITINPILSNVEKASAWSSTSADKSITLTVPDAILEQNPTNATAGTVSYRDYNFSVSGGATYYTVALGAVNGYSGVLRGQSNSAATIGKVSANTKASDIASNTWGYSLKEISSLNATVDDSTLTYNPVSNTPTNIITRQKLNGNKNYRLAFAANIGANSPADHYQTKLYLSVVGEIATMSEISTMQEMTSEICRETPAGYTKQLIDSREPSKKYWVAKLADGQCWMTQNLDYDIPKNGTLLASNTDVASDIPIEAKKFTNTTTVAEWSINDSYQVSYYDPGLIVKKNPASNNGACNYSGIVSITDQRCITAGFIDVSSKTASTTDNGDGNNPVSTSEEAKVINGDVYDAHYLVGNYYSWNAATAGTGENAGEAYGNQAANSICPKGWKLPTAGNKLGTTMQANGAINAGNTDSYNVAGSFSYLLRQYGLATSYNAGTSPATASNSNPLTANKTYTIYDAPLYFLQSGHVTSTQFSNAGVGGYYWSSVAMGVNQALPFSIWMNSQLKPASQDSSASATYSGASVRCVAK